MTLAVAFKPRLTNPQIIIPSRQRRLNINRRYATAEHLHLPFPALKDRAKFIRRSATPGPGRIHHLVRSRAVSETALAFVLDA
jgi:hypothetical protein